MTQSRIKIDLKFY